MYTAIAILMLAVIYAAFFALPFRLLVGNKLPTRLLASFGIGTAMFYASLWLLFTFYIGE